MAWKIWARHRSEISYFGVAAYRKPCPCSAAEKAYRAREKWYFAPSAYIIKSAGHAPYRAKISASSKHEKSAWRRAEKAAHMVWRETLIILISACQYGIMSAASTPAVGALGDVGGGTADLSEVSREAKHWQGHDGN